MLNKLTAAAALAGALAGSHAGAESMQIGYLGIEADRSACVGKALRALEAYNDRHGGSGVTGNNLAAESWSAYGWDFKPGSNDVVVMCIFTDKGVEAFFAAHGLGENKVAADNLAVLSDQLKAAWRDTP